MPPVWMWPTLLNKKVNMSMLSRGWNTAQAAPNAA